MMRSKSPSLCMQSSVIPFTIYRKNHFAHRYRLKEVSDIRPLIRMQGIPFSLQARRKWGQSSVSVRSTARGCSRFNDFWTTLRKSRGKNTMAPAPGNLSRATWFPVAVTEDRTIFPWKPRFINSKTNDEAAIVSPTETAWIHNGREPISSSPNRGE